MTTATVRALEIGEDYLAAWKRKDIKAIEQLIHPMVHLKSPVADVTGKN